MPLSLSLRNALTCLEPRLWTCIKMDVVAEVELLTQSEASKSSTERRKGGARQFPGKPRTLTAEITFQSLPSSGVPPQSYWISRLSKPSSGVPKLAHLRC